MDGYANTSLRFHGEASYPPVQAAQRNFRYAQAMLDNVGGGNSEMSAVALYVYDHLVTADIHEVAEAFHRMSMVEMRHLEIFGTLARQLGEDPRLWGINQGRRQWWTPGCLTYQNRLGPLLRQAARDEKAAIRKYRAQARWIGDANIVENLRRIIEDEECHLEVLAKLYDEFVGSKMGNGNEVGGQ